VDTFVTVPITRRIAAAFSPDAFGALAQTLSDRMQQHLAEVTTSQAKVLNWRHPQENIRSAHAAIHHKRLSQEEAEQAFQTKALQQRFAKLIDEMLLRGQNLHDPRYIGHQVPASSPLAALFDALGSMTNQVMAIYEMGPFASAVERTLVSKLGGMFYHQESFDEEATNEAQQEQNEIESFAGLITHGGSLANLTALLTARNIMLERSWEEGVRQTPLPPVLIVHSDAHYCISRSAGILGLGTQQIIRAPLDAMRRIDVEQLRQLVVTLKQNGQPIMAVCAAACATPIGAFDRLDEVADICEEFNLWLHVDAAHGGAAIFSEEHRHLLKGIERADSFICDAHKMMFVPALCAFVFYRDRAHRFEAFRQEAPYLFDPTLPGDMAEYDCGLMTVECTKRAAAFGLWGLWSLFGQELFRDLVDRTFALAQHFHAMLIESKDFEPLHDPQCNIVCFRYRPDSLSHLSPQELGDVNRRIRRRLIESGEFYIVQTTLDGIGALRLTVMNPLTTENHLAELLDAIRHCAGQCEQPGN